MSIKIGILGYGNLGRGVECAVKQNDDMESCNFGSLSIGEREPAGICYGICRR